MQKLAIIANPISGGGRAFKMLERYLRKWPHKDWSVEVHATRCAGHAGVLALELLRQPPDLLAVCGGDGTISEIASSVPDPPFPVAILPSGTANVLARELELPLSPIRALRVALQGNVRRVDLGGLHGRQQRRFLCMVGVGLDAYIVATVRPRLKQRLGIASYYVATLRAFHAYPFREFNVRIADEEFKATWCLIANTRAYGGGLVFAPDADMQDGLFDVLYIQGKERTAQLRLLLSAWRGRPRHRGVVQSRRAASLRIEGPPGLWVQADGEFAGALPQDIILSPACYPLMVRR